MILQRTCCQDEQRHGLVWGYWLPFSFLVFRRISNADGHGMNSCQLVYAKAQSEHWRWSLNSRYPKRNFLNVYVHQTEQFCQQVGDPDHDMASFFVRLASNDFLEERTCSVRRIIFIVFLILIDLTYKFSRRVTDLDCNWLAFKWMGCSLRLAKEHLNANQINFHCNWSTVIFILVFCNPFIEEGNIYIYICQEKKSITILLYSEWELCS